MHIKTFLLALLCPMSGWAQQILPVPVQHPSPKGEEIVTMRGEEKIISGVTEPTLSVYLPDEKVNTGAAVILCPGGAMRMLSWTNDVERMSRILNERGIAAIGLKYRLNNAPMDMTNMSSMPELVDVTGFQKFNKANANPLPSKEGDQANLNAVDDARNAIKLVRAHAKEWKIDPAKVGFLGFSAGGGVDLSPFAIGAVHVVF
ncbi:MAG: alpha/beta hydrolase, partial [Bacteroidaceae bacterium]|nr:alpha/beta hydrolase [Bacteroidaceae bacterium]